MAGVTDPKTIAVANLEPDAADSAFDPDLDLPVEPLAPRVAAPSSAPRQVQTPAQVHQHTRGNVQRALRLGATRDEIDATDPDSLDAWIDGETEARTREAVRMEREAAFREYEKQQRQPAAALPAAPPEDDYEVPADEIAGLEATNPGVAKFSKKAPKDIKAALKRIADLEARLNTRDQTDSQKQGAEFIDALDEAFDGLAQPDIYGDGPGLSLKETSDERRLRESVIAASGITKGDSAKTIARKLAAEHKLRYGKVIKKPATGAYGGVVPDEEEEPAPVAPSRSLAAKQPNGKPRITREQFEGAVTNAPTPRARKAQKTVNGAVRAVQEQMQAARQGGDDFGWEEEGLPD